MKNKEKLSKADELEREAKELRSDVQQEEHTSNIKNERNFAKKTKIDVYCSDDYAGLDSGKYHFYFGYEVTHCPVKSHKDDNDCYEKDCDKREDCFIATIDEKEVMKLTRSQLHPKTDEDVLFLLLAGIGHFLKKEK